MSKSEASATATKSGRAKQPIEQGLLQQRFSPLTTGLQGLALCLIVAMAATFLSDHYGAPVMLFALLIGMALHPLADVPQLQPGIAATSNTLLKTGVALLGFQITGADVTALGTLPPLLAIAGVGLTIGLGLVLSKIIRRPAAFGILTGGAVGICGASAALALASVMPRGRAAITEQCIAFTVLGVTTLSTIAMVLYPLMTDALQFDSRMSGIFIGATIHDVAQVVGAGYSISQEAGEVATVTKLFRVALLVPVVAVAAWWFGARGRMVSSSQSVEGSIWPVPPFLVAFVLFVTVNSVGLVPEAVCVFLTEVSRWFLVIAIAAIGIKTSILELRQFGVAGLMILIIETFALGALAVVAIT